MAHDAPYWAVESSNDEDSFAAVAVVWRVAFGAYLITDYLATIFRDDVYDDGCVGGLILKMND